MATAYEFLRGKASWVRVLQPDDFGKWKMTLYPDAASLVKINLWIEKGLKNKLRKDDDGYCMVFSRPHQRQDKMGRMSGVTPVIVLDKNGIPFTELIGNGSDVTIKVETYPYSPPGKPRNSGFAAKLMAIKIETLVPYKKEDNTEQETLQAKGVVEQPNQIVPW